jgi:broad specificity phosphatase PhoE
MMRSRATRAARVDAATECRPRIILMRHGRPDVNLPRSIRPCDWAELVRRYDHAGLRDDSLPGVSLAHVASQCRLIVCSPLRRSLESAQRLSSAHPLLCDDMFREVALPHPHWRQPRLHPYIWGVVLRGLWRLSLGSNGEDRDAAQRRIDEVAHRLIGIAVARGSVLLVGHGVLNQLLARNLRRRGWRGPWIPDLGFWGFGVYTRR